MIKLQEKDKVTDCIFSWIPVLVIPFAFMKNMMSRFDRVITTWIAEILPREKSQPVFAYKSMVHDHSCCSCTKQVQITKVFEP